MKLSTHTIQGIDVVAIDASMIELANSRTLQKALDAYLDDSQGPVVLDMTATTFISSSGVGVLAHLIRRTQEEERSLLLVSPHDTIHQLFKVTRLITFDHVDLVGTLDEAVTRTG